MKKTILTIAAAAALLVFSAIGVSAADNLPAVEPVEGSYTVTYNVGAANAGSMYGMVAITGTTINEDSIVYIDQATADANGEITFTNFIPKVAPGEQGFEESTVYIGGPNLGQEGAKAIAVLMDEEPAGVAVSGSVTSYNPKNATTVNLKQDSEVKYSTTIAALAEGSGVATQTFELVEVAAGTYDLVVSKDGHLDYTITGVVVGDAAVDLTSKNVSLLAGDINADTFINEDDVKVIRYATNINKEVAEAASAVTDLNGDGFVNEDDVKVVRYDVNINTSMADCTVAY